MLKAQSPIDASQFFARALAGSDTTGVADEVNRIRFPWIEAYDLRMRTNDFDANKNEYTVRFTPNSIQKRKAQQALSDHLNKEPDFGQQEAFCDQLSDVYEDWLSLYVIHEKTQLLRALDTVIKDRRRVFEKMAGAYDFDFKELLQLQTAENDLQITLHELSLEEDRLRAAYSIASNDPFDFGRFVDMQALQTRLGIRPADSLSSKAAKIQYEQELLSKELALEIAESKQIFDFAQIRYEGPRTDLFQERLSLGIGLRIPHSGNSLIKIQELELKRKALAREQARDAIQRKQDLNNLQQKLIRDISAFSFYQQTIAAERTQLQNLGNQIARKEGFDPILLLDIEERHIETRLKAFRKFEEILVDYLRYLEESGRLCRETGMNFLGGL